MVLSSSQADSADAAAEEPFLRLRVAEHTIAAGDVAIVAFEPVDGGQLPWWTPGTHIALRTDVTDIVREYSLCGSPRDRGRWTIAVRLAEQSRGGSRFVHERLRAGAEVLVNRVSNHFEFRPTARPCFIAGGIGITPILPMVEATARYGADWNLVYVGRDRSSMPFLERLEQYGERVTVIETSRAGRPDMARIVSDNAGSHIFSCGPEPLLDALSAAAAADPRVALTVERFTPRTIELPEREIPFSVVVNSTGQEVPVQPEQTTLAALLAAGVRVPNSCGEGTCGSCETVVLAGIPDHRDSILSEKEQAAGEYMYVCVSRSRTPTLTLDL